MEGNDLKEEEIKDKKITSRNENRGLRYSMKITMKNFMKIRITDNSVMYWEDNSMFENLLCF